MDCAEIRNQINAYIDGELGPMTAKRVERHLKECPSCHKEYKSLVNASNIVKSLKSEPVPEEVSACLRLKIESERQKQQDRVGVISFYKRPSFRALAAAAALIIAFSVGMELKNIVPSWRTVDMARTVATDVDMVMPVVAGETAHDDATGNRDAGYLAAEKSAVDAMGRELKKEERLEVAESEGDMAPTATDDFDDAVQPSADVLVADGRMEATARSGSDNETKSIMGLTESEEAEPRLMEPSIAMAPAPSPATVTAPAQPAPASEPMPSTVLAEETRGRAADESEAYAAAGEAPIEEPPAEVYASAVELPAHAVSYGTRRPNYSSGIMLNDLERVYTPSYYMVLSPPSGTSEYEFEGIDQDLLASIDNYITIFVEGEFETEYQRVKQAISEVGGRIISETSIEEGESPVRKLLVSVPGNTLNRMLALSQTVPGQAQMILNIDNEGRIGSAMAKAAPESLGGAPDAGSDSAIESHPDVVIVITLRSD